ncbi:MAG: toxic anion resistance protein [Atopobiaceae bacterium]|nr:toxic anion resistance protein [Atopobiaceae bacterium]
MSEKNEFALIVPDVDKVTEEVEAKLSVSEAQKEATGTAMERQADAIMGIDLSDIESRDKARQAIEQLGAGTTALTASQSRMTATSLRALAEEGNTGSEIATNLSDLAIRMRQLDPSKIDFARKGLFAKFHDPVERYFEQFKSARSEIEAVMVSLKRGRNTLAADNIELERQEVTLIKDSQTLAKELDMANQLEEALTEAIARAEDEGVDPEKVRFVRQEILFPLEQKRQDLQTLLAVNQQGIVAMSVLRENNRALITNIDRTSQISLRALDTGVMIQHALHDQQVQMEKVKMVGEVTESIIRGNAEALRTQGAEIQRKSAEAMIDPEVIKDSFEQVFAALEEGDAYRDAAIPRMQATIAELQAITDKGQARLDRLAQAGRLAITDGK